ncbi:MAG: cupin domain-containing protein [bacterium]|nr:cupin domain-containing protein [bacterium]
MKGFFDHLEKITEENENYRKVLYTAKHCQLVLMALKPNEEIGEEIHTDNDQFFRFESGNGKVIIDGNEYNVAAGDGVIVPTGAKHNVINTGSEILKIYTIYSPAHHKDQTIHPTKASETEEHFDGQTTE